MNYKSLNKKITEQPLQGINSVIWQNNSLALRVYPIFPLMCKAKSRKELKIMGKILDEIFANCEFASTDSEKLFKNSKIVKCDYQLETQSKEFLGKIENDILKTEYQRFYTEFKAIICERDSELLKLFTIRGMLIHMQLQAEILNE